MGARRPWFRQRSYALAHDLEHLPRDARAARYDQIAEVRRMLYRFMQSLSAPGLRADR